MSQQLPLPGDQPGKYSFEVRFGTPAISEGVVPIPRIVLDNYAILGIDDRTMMWVVHLLAYKWSAESPFPKRASLRCMAGEASQKRYARNLRVKGLLFTSRKFRKGRVVSLIYDLNSLLHNCVRVHEAIQVSISAYIETEMPNVDPLDRYLRSYVRDQVVEQALAAFKVELPDDVLARLKAGEYDDVPPPWSALAPEIEGEALLEQYLGPRPVQLTIQVSSGANVADPVQAGGASSSAEAVVDGLCRFNKLPGIDTLPAGERTNLVRHVHEIIERWGSATPDQARLAWQAWTLRFGWRGQCNAFYTNFATEYGMLLTAVKEGTITLESLQEEGREQERQANRKDPNRPRDHKVYEQHWQDVELPQPAPDPRPEWWIAVLTQLRLQTTETAFDTWLKDTTATRENGMVTVIANNARILDWLQHRMNALILRTACRVFQVEQLTLAFALQEGTENDTQTKIEA